jgi:hypothetical protein
MNTPPVVILCIGAVAKVALCALLRLLANEARELISQTRLSTSNGPSKSDSFKQKVIRLKRQHSHYGGGDYLKPRLPTLGPSYESQPVIEVCAFR